MAKGVNKVFLLGNVGKDPEIRATQGGMTIASFTLATADRQKGQDGQWTDKTEISLAPGEISDVPVSVALLADKPASSSQTLRFKVTDVDEPWVYSAADSRFVAPLNR